MPITSPEKPTSAVVLRIKRWADNLHPAISGFIHFVIGWARS